MHDIARFHTKYEIDASSECWNWKASKGRYGGMRVRGQPMGSHRAAWTLLVGEIPRGACVLHRCDNPRCVNPEHLRLGTQADNLKDMRAKGRRVRQVNFDGSKNPRSRLSREQALEIRKLATKGCYRKLAERYGVNASTVQRIAAGKIWKDP